MKEVIDCCLEIDDEGNLYIVTVTPEGLTWTPIFEDNSDAYTDVEESDNVVLEVDSEDDDDDSDLVQYLPDPFTVKDGVIIMHY
ncbi:hypothetical protein EBR43_12630 [bacterium]|nr:hypothetical protein [bacterium]